MEAWLVKDPNAPFPYHMYVFNGDGTMQQANPDAGDSHGSDSDGKGIWVTDGERIKAGAASREIGCRISSDWTHLISPEWDHPISG